jgi:hypothetical protein
VYTKAAMTRCGHPLCQLLGDECSLATGLSRGCRTGPRTASPFGPELVEEVSTLLAQLGPAPPGDAGAAERQRVAATRLAFLFRREKRNDRNLLVLGADDELEPELRARLEALCRRHA